MDSERKRKKDFVKNIRTVSEYKEYLDSLILTDEERQIADMVFLKGYNYALIGDTLGLSERTVKRRVSKILSKI